jgi:sulfur-carrier protein
MALVIFSPFIQQHVPCPPLEVFGNTVGEVLAAYFDKHRHARGYILDEQGCLRPRLSLFVDGVIAADRIGLGDPVHAHAKVHVQQMPLNTEYEDLD